jgi:CubicO group peptidase (beta-lactamase class C family)
MDPIGASDTWEWLPYRNAWIDIYGQTLPSVLGGAHWGGGIFISAQDHARVGLMVLNDGQQGGQRILPEGWVDFLRTPSPCFDNYGTLWWLNTRCEQYSTAPPPASSPWERANTLSGSSPI